jgi:putative aminopeptidase FrvX
MFDQAQRDARLDDHDWLWSALARLLSAHAPSGGANLPGAVGGVIRDLAAALDLADRFIPRIGSTGNAGIWLGAQRDQPDLVIAAHMDRPSFRVGSVSSGRLYPICAERFPQGLTQSGAKALRFADGRLIAGARGRLLSDKRGEISALHFRAESGELHAHDTITLDAEPTLIDGIITASGLDNALGVLTALGAAARLRGAEAALIAQDRRALIVFTDQEEGDPTAFFGHGAARLAYAVPPPRIGAICADAQSVVDETGLALGGGAGHGVISSWGRGSVVPPNFAALARDLAAVVNAERPNTVQINDGYISRSDDLALSRWTQILALIGVPMRDAHTDHERAALVDVPSAIHWLTRFSAAALGLDADLARRYALVT